MRTDTQGRKRSLLLAILLMVAMLLPGLLWATSSLCMPASSVCTKGGATSCPRCCDVTPGDHVCSVVGCPSVAIGKTPVAVIVPIFLGTISYPALISPAIFGRSPEPDPYPPKPLPHTVMDSHRLR